MPVTIDVATKFELIKKKTINRKITIQKYTYIIILMYYVPVQGLINLFTLLNLGTLWVDKHAYCLNNIRYVKKCQMPKYYSS